MAPILPKARASSVIGTRRATAPGPGHYGESDGSDQSRAGQAWASSRRPLPAERRRPGERLVEANAAPKAGGYLPTDALSVAGYLSDAMGLASGAIAFATVPTGLAVIGGLVVADRR
ncbi:hypothetical protein [Streptomyces sp. 2333.5]|uniref:hypothetical protein n=1 Tax=unclassified Streptomyces TaxID=2593676 RepID=UPI00115FC102|nr:hypothetical protein [Streptomyces sp. 2333.5]